MMIMVNMLPYNNEDLKSPSSQKTGCDNIRPAQLAEEKKQFLLSVVQKYPGIQYRQALRITGLSNGSLSYAVRVLESQKRLKVRRANSNKITRLYPIEFDDDDNNNEFTYALFEEINHQTSKKIIIALLVTFKGHCTLKQLSMEVHRSPSTIHWHLKRMLGKQILSVTENKHNHTKLYSFCNENKDKILSILNNSAGVSDLLKNNIDVFLFA